MNTRTRVASLALAGVLSLSAAAAAQQQGRDRAPACINEWELPNGCDPARVTPKQLNPRDLSGVWERSKGAANMQEKFVLTEEGKRRMALNKPSFGPRAVIPALGNDPMGTCDPLGLTRNIFLEVGGRSFEFAHMPDRTLQFFEWAHQFREIWMDGRQLPKNPVPRWMGYSVGRWEGDTLVVDTIGLEERTWLDMWGVPHSDQVRVEERYRRTSPGQIEFTMRITDPVVFTQPFVSDTKILSLAREKTQGERLETFCVPSDEQEFNETIRNPAGGVKR